MIKYLLAAVALVVAGVPAALGTVGNASFTRDIPVRVPDSAQTGTPSTSTVPGADDDGTADRGKGAVGTEAGDDHGTHVEPGDDKGTHVEPGDDKGTHLEPGDDSTHRGHDNTGSKTGSSGSGSRPSGGGSGSGSGHGGSDDSGSGSGSDSGSDSGGHHGSDDG